MIEHGDRNPEPRPPRFARQPASAVSGDGRLGLSGAATVVFAALAASAGALLNLPGPDVDPDVPYAVIFPPWTSERTAVSLSLAAGLRVLRGGAWPFVVVVAAAEGRQPAETATPGVLMVRLAGLAGCLDRPDIAVMTK